MFTNTNIRRGAAALFALALGFAGAAFADGPVAPGALPGGVAVADSDSGNGQRWGRAGGRDITFTVNTPAAFGTLSWGVVRATLPNLAFDGNVNTGTPEVMTNVSTPSDYASGRAVFNGLAVLPFANGSSFLVPTRFTLTMRTTSNVPIALGDISGGANPGINALASGPFRANLLFEMQYLPAFGGDNSYRPVLDLYDSLATIPGNLPATNVGPVMTGVQHGFYYTGAGLTLEEHDQHIEDLLAPIGSKITFIRDDWTGRWNGIQGQVQDVNTNINTNIRPTLDQIQSQVQQLLGQGNGTGNLATRDDVNNAVNNAKNSLQGILFVMLGFDACPASQTPPGFCDAFKSMKQLGLATTQIQVSLDGILIGLNRAATQASLDALSAKIDDLQDAIDGAGSPSLEMVVAPIDSQGSQQRRWIVKISRDGALVGASLTRVSTVRSGKGATAYANVTGNSHVVTLAPGVFEVTVDMIKDVTDGSMYVFEASFSAGGATLQGSALAAPGK